MSLSLTSRYPFREKSRTAAGLALAQSFWALTERAMPMMASLELAVQEGVTFFEAGLREDRMPVIQEVLQRFPLRLIAQGWALNAAEAEPFFQRAARLGAEALNLHLGHAYLSNDEAAALIETVLQRADVYGIPLLLETHRGRLTQDLYRTAAVAVESTCAIALDVSHYIVAGETLGGDAEGFHRHLEPLLQRTALIHGRVSNGAAIQVHPADPLACVTVTQAVWQRAMELWLADAPADAVLVFEPELGPPPYAYQDGQQKETFSRTVATPLLVDMAQHAWSNAVAAHQMRMAMGVDA